MNLLKSEGSHVLLLNPPHSVWEFFRLQYKGCTKRVVRGAQARMRHIWPEISQMTDAKPSRTITSRENIRNEPRTHTSCINPWARAGLLRLVLRQSIAIPSGSPVSLRTPPSTRLDSLSVLSLCRFYPGTNRGENNASPRIRSRIARNNSRETATSDRWNVTYRA